MDYKAAIRNALDGVRHEGRYRVFADLKRHRGDFPFATWTAPSGETRDVTVWCSNDYLGQGQNPVVLEAMHRAIDEAGSGSGGTRNISGTTHYHVELEAELAELHGKSAALLFTSGFVSNEATLATLQKILPGRSRPRTQHRHDGSPAYLGENTYRADGSADHDSVTPGK